MPLTLYTKPGDDKLIEDVKIKAVKEKLSVSEVALRLLKMWVRGEIKINSDREVRK
jgi:hypothetical protein